MKITAKEDEYSTASMNPDNRPQFLICLSNAGTEATTWSFTDMGYITDLLEREINCITMNEQKRLQKELSIRWIKFETLWDTIGIQPFQKMIKQRAIGLEYRLMPIVRHTSETIRSVKCSENFTNDSSDWLYIAMVNKTYCSTNNINYIPQMLKHNDRCTSRDYIEETLLYLALQGLYDIDSVKAFNQLSTTDIWQSTHRAHLTHL